MNNGSVFIQIQANGHAFGDGASIYIGHTIDEAELNAEHDHQFFVRQMPNGETLLYRETDENIKIIAYYESDYKVVSTYKGQLYLLVIFHSAKNNWK